MLSRGKHVLRMDLKDSKDKEKLLKEVIPNINVLLESYRPGVMEKLGISPEVCHQLNPILIYVRLSGYGNKPSRYSQLAGHDGNYLSLSGILNKFRRIHKNSNPVPPSNFLADFSYGSLFCF